MEDFKRYCGKAHFQVLMLLWVTERLKLRQNDKNSNAALAITAIEKDLIQFSSEFNQHLDFQFDRGDTLLILASPLIVGGVESISKIDTEQDRNNIINYVENELHNIVEPVINNATTLLSHNNEQQPSHWTLFRRLRNSLSHFRYKYDGDTGKICFEDFNQRGQTMDLTMPLVSALNISYRFGKACIAWAEQNGYYP